MESFLYKQKRGVAQYFEGRRLRGQRTFFGIYSLISPRFIMWVMPLARDMGGYLLATKLREGPTSPKTLLRVMLSLEGLQKGAITNHERRTISQSIAHKLIETRRGPLWEKVRQALNATEVEVHPIGFAKKTREK